MSASWGGGQCSGCLAALGTAEVSQPLAHTVPLCKGERGTVPPGERSPAPGHRAVARGAQAVSRLAGHLEPCTSCTAIRDRPVAMRALQPAALCVPWTTVSLVTSNNVSGERTLFTAVLPPVVVGETWEVGALAAPAPQYVPVAAEVSACVWAPLPARGLCCLADGGFQPL